MKRLLLISLLIGALPLGMAAQDDDLYFVPKKKSVEKVTEDYVPSGQTYYSGSTRSVDDYNRRKSHYEVIDGDSTLTDVIDFSGEMGVYPDSLTDEDFAATRQLNRFEGYELSDNSAYWAGYRDGRYDWGWHSPFYYSRYGWYDYYGPWGYGWYDPWYYGYAGWYGWYDPWYYGWGYPWHYGWNYPYYYAWDYPYYYGGGGGGRLYASRSNTGTINHYAGTMSGRNYAPRSSYASAGSSRGRATASRLGATRQSSLRNRSVSGHQSYSRNSSYTSDRSYSNNSSSSFNNHSSYSSSSGSSGGSFSRSSGGGYSGGGGGGRAGGSHVGSRR